MADEKEFAKELNELIKRYIDGKCNPVFGHYNLEIYLEAKPITRGC